jgi:hypothetical protein
VPCVNGRLFYTKRKNQKVRKNADIHSGKKAVCIYSTLKCADEEVNKSITKMKL